MNQREYLRLKEQIEKRYRDDLAALNRIWELSRRSDSESNQRQSHVAPREEAAPAQDITSPVRLVREALPPPGKQFTVKTIEEAIREAHPDLNGTLTQAVLSSTLRRMADGEGAEIRVHQMGRGRRPTVYEVAMMR